MEQYVLTPEILQLPRHNYKVYSTINGGGDKLPSEIKELPKGEDEVIMDDKDYHLEIRNIGDDIFYFLFDESALEQFEQFEQSLNVPVALIVPAICLIALWMGFLFPKSIISPLTKLSNQVAKLNYPGDAEIGSGDKPLDEPGTLEITFSAYQKRIAKFLSREQQFSSDVSHELRTPLMGIQSAAENLLNERPDNNRY